MFLKNIIRIFQCNAKRAEHASKHYIVRSTCIGNRAYKKICFYFIYFLFMYVYVVNIYNKNIINKIKIFIFFSLLLSFLFFLFGCLEILFCTILFCINRVQKYKNLKPEFVAKFVFDKPALYPWQGYNKILPV